MGGDHKRPNKQKAPQFLIESQYVRSCQLQLPSSDGPPIAYQTRLMQVAPMWGPRCKGSSRPSAADMRPRWKL